MSLVDRASKRCGVARPARRLVACAGLAAFVLAGAGTPVRAGTSAPAGIGWHVSSGTYPAWSPFTGVPAVDTGDPVSGARASLLTATSASDSHFLALRADGTVWGWGQNVSGELGDGTNGDIPKYLGPGTNVPVRAKIGDVVAIAAGDSFSAAVRSDGTLWWWGEDPCGGTGSSTPVQKAGVSGALGVSASPDYFPDPFQPDHALAVLSNGTVFAWGDNSRGQLGDGTTSGSCGTSASGLSGAVAVAAGRNHSLALTSGGTVYAWGANGFGQLGNGATTNSLTPVAVSGLSGVVAISAGADSSFALKSDGTVWGWGSDASDALGGRSPGPCYCETAPVRITGIPAAVAISAGGLGGAVVAADGSIWGWGFHHSATAPARGACQCAVDRLPIPGPVVALDFRPSLGDIVAIQGIG